MGDRESTRRANGRQGSHCDTKRSPRCRLAGLLLEKHAMRSHVIPLVPCVAAGLAGAWGGAAAPENEVTQELTGIIEQFTTGFATIEIGSSVHFGLVFAPDLVFPHASWVTGVAPASIRVRQ